MAKKRLVKRTVNSPYHAFYGYGYYPWYWGTDYGYDDVDYDLDNSPYGNSSFDGYSTDVFDGGFDGGCDGGFDGGCDV